MERRTFLKSTSLCTAAVTMLPFAGKTMMVGKEEGRETFIPVDNRKALVNPDMGWTMHYYSNILSNYGSKLDPSDTLDDFPGLSTVYLRVPWAFLEPEEGKYNWELLDTPAQRWIEKGKRVAFRVSAEESWMKYATPQWVKNAGAKGFDLEWGEQGLWEPKFDDRIFLEKVENFVAAMAHRYDGSPYVDFVDVGHMGMWGEGHTVFTAAQTKVNDYPFEVKKKHIDIYLKHFKNTLLCISDDFAGHDKAGKNFPISDYAFSRGVTIRDDSIMVQKPPRHWYHAEMAQQFWPKLPVILEHEHYGSSVERGAWDQERFLQSVEEYHASYMSIHWWPRILLNENRDVIDKINLRMGYRLQLKEVSWPDKINVGETFRIKYKWSNAGVAPCYRGGYPCFTVKDKKGGIIAVLVDEQLNVKNLKTGAPGESPLKTMESEFTIGLAYKDSIKSFARNVQRGTFELYVSVGQADGTPVYELPYSGDDGFKRYKLGSISIEE